MSLEYWHLLGPCRAIAKAVSEAVPTAETGGCRAFYSPEEWGQRGEDYGTDSELVIVHDGGDLSVAGGYSPVWEKINAALHERGLWAEQCTGWYSAVYKED